MKDLSQFFKALSDPTRLQIIALLSWRKELCVCDIENILRLSQSKVSRHLRYLLTSGILTDTRKNKWVYYSLNKELSDHKKNIFKIFREIIKEESWEELKVKYSLWAADTHDHCSIQEDK